MAATGLRSLRAQRSTARTPASRRTLGSRPAVFRPLTRSFLTLERESVKALLPSRESGTRVSLFLRANSNQMHCRGRGPIKTSLSNELRLALVRGADNGIASAPANVQVR